MKCFFFNDTATTEIYTLSLHDALPIYVALEDPAVEDQLAAHRAAGPVVGGERSEEHTSELQSRQYLVCRLLLEQNNHEKGKPSRLAESRTLRYRAETPEVLDMVQDYTP